VSAAKKGPKNQSLMWEVRCEAGRTAAMEDWVRSAVVPALWDDEQVASYSVYSSVGQDGDRVVVVVDYLGKASAADLPAIPPEGLAARPAHSWVFERLDM
jgi:hypothetical protein